MGYMGPYFDIPKAIFYLRRGDYNPNPLGTETPSLLVGSVMVGVLTIWEFTKIRGLAFV